MARIQELKKCLGALLDKNLSKYELTNMACNVLLEFYEIHGNKESIDDKEKLNILNMISSASDQLANYAETYKNRLYLPSDRDEVLTCKLQSGFQYLKDDYLNSRLLKQLDESTRKSLNQFLDLVDYEELQECMEKWVEFSYQPPKPDFVPNEHFWWNKEG